MFFPGETASFCLVFLCTKQIPDNTGPAQVGEESEITGAKSSIGVITTSNLSETWVRNRGTLPETRQLDDAGTTAKKKTNGFRGGFFILDPQTQEISDLEWIFFWQVSALAFVV